MFLRLFMQTMPCAFDLADVRLGKMRLASSEMIATTTKSSMSVNPLLPSALLFLIPSSDRGIVRVISCPFMIGSPVISFGLLPDSGLYSLLRGADLEPAKVFSARKMRTDRD